VFNQHISSDAEDPQTLTLILPAAFKISILTQYYSLEGDFLRALNCFQYALLTNVLQTVEQPYGLRILTALIQYYGDTPAVRRLLAQYYGSATMLRRICSQPYGDYLKMVAALDQEWSLPEALRRTMEQRYSMAGERLTTLMAEQYDISEYQLLRSMLEQIYVLPPGESLVQTPVISVTADGIALDPHHINIEVDEGSYFIRGEIHLADEAEFFRCRHMQTVLAVTINETTYTLLADSPRKSRPELGRQEYYVSAVSPTVRLDAPYATPISREFAGAMASTIAAEMAATAGITLDWQLLDWYIPAATLYANGETPLAVIRKLVEAVGGIIQTTPAGVLLCRPEYPLSLPDWPTATPDFYLTDMDNFFSVDSTPVIRDGYNRFLVSNQDAATAGLTLEAIDIDAMTKEIRVYQVPWNDASAINLETSGGAWVSIVAEGVVEESITDLVEIVAGEGRTTKPIYALTSYAYQQAILGAVTIAEDGHVATELADNSLISMTYQTRYHKFIARDARIEDVQFFPEEVTP
jgi:antitoxin component HigA of HigAB toxin-antitoxin module